MANLKEIRNRIASVSSTMQITSAMKMVSAAKLKKAQDAITAMRPYSDKLTELIQALSASADTDQPNPYTVVRQEEKILLVAITSNRGLCGAFNTNVIKETLRLSKEEFEGKTVELVTIGKKGSDILSKSLPFKSSHDDVFDDLTFDNTAKVAESIMEAFAGAEYDKVVLIYNRFKNAATQLITVEPFLPIVSESSEEETSNGDYLFEPSQAEIIDELLPKSLKIQLFKAIRDSLASEHGARMTAMHKATDNATELRDQLKLTYNKARQAAITNEILEIVGGAEALKG
ncbi:ATP synthase F1 subunit gamma [Flavobacteriaceae bacterium]|jgi:F-type H+-transporting ATPase subunit gamma|nr:ATP synthase F1 subunit gamma [Flavobacteriaceae bacterium]|tara:strand:- start:5 stop:868 length:864 start_codon:yes stop_codon:yes gene_type:complete